MLLLSEFLLTTITMQICVKLFTSLFSCFG